MVVEQKRPVRQGTEGSDSFIDTLKTGLEKSVIQTPLYSSKTWPHTGVFIMLALPFSYNGAYFDMVSRTSLQGDLMITKW